MNKDLADVLGNFVSRVTKFCRSKWGEEVPAGGDLSEKGAALIDDLQGKFNDYTAQMDAIEVRRAAATLRSMWVAGNEFLQSAAPWTTFKEDPEAAAADIRLALNLIRLYAVISAPFIPFSSARMLADLGTDDTSWPGDLSAALTRLKPGHGFTVPEVLFAKIADETREGWATRFSGIRS